MWSKCESSGGYIHLTQKSICMCPCVTDKNAFSEFLLSKTVCAISRTIMLMLFSEIVLSKTEFLLWKTAYNISRTNWCLIVTKTDFLLPKLHTQKIGGLGFKPMILWICSIMDLQFMPYMLMDLLPRLWNTSCYSCSGINNYITHLHISRTKSMF